MTTHVCFRASWRATIVPALLALSLHLSLSEGSAAELSESTDVSRDGQVDQRGALPAGDVDFAAITGAIPAAGRTDSLTAVYAAGDQIKVTAFEIISGGSNSGEALLNGLVERPELTAEYTIQQDGTLVLPFVGSMRAAGQTQHQVEKALEKDYFRALGIQLKVAPFAGTRADAEVAGNQEGRTCKSASAVVGN